MTAQLSDSFCSTDPAVAKVFARTTFFADNRADLPLVSVPSVVLQCAQDAIAPTCVGEYMHRHLPGSRYQLLDVVGHCPHLTHPQATIAALQQVLDGGPAAR